MHWYKIRRPREEPPVYVFSDDALNALRKLHKREDIKIKDLSSVCALSQEEEKELEEKMMAAGIRVETAKARVYYS